MDDTFAMGYTMGKDSNGNCNDGMFGGGNSWIWIIVVFALLFGWGDRGGNGANGGGNSGGGCNMPTFIPYGLGGFNASGADTRSAIYDGFAMNNLQRGVNAIQQGICDSTYALNNAITGGFNTTQMNMMQGFNGVERGFCNLSSQISDCCCQTQRAIDGVNYNMAKNTCDLQNTMNNNTRDILDNQNGNARAILDFLTQDKIATLQAENQSLKLAASQSAQNAYLTATIDAGNAELIRRLGRDNPVPAYVVPNPNCCYGNPLGVSYGYNQGGNCGCGSGYGNCCA